MLQRTSTFVCPGPNLRNDWTTRDFDQKLSILGHDSGSANFRPWPFASAAGLDRAISAKKGNARVIRIDLACDARDTCGTGQTQQAGQTQRERLIVAAG